MRLRLAVGVAVVATVAAASVVGGALTLRLAPATAATGGCSKTTAAQVATRLHGVDPGTGRTPIFQVLCGPFLGPGSQGMVASVAVPTGCGGSIEWAVFRFAAGTWQLVMERRNGAFLSAAGSDIRERVGAPKPGDPPCSPSAWKARIWHWNGTSFTATPWKQSTSGTSTAPVGASKSGYFKTPSGNIVCSYFLGSKASVACGIKSGLKPKPPYTAACKAARLDYNADRIGLGATGRAQPVACSGDAGPFIGESSARVLGYGKTWSGGGLHCTSAFTGLTCRNKSGNGFFLSREHWRPF
jgi:hypothetical protein